MVAITESPQGGVVRMICRKAWVDDDAACQVNLSDEMVKVCIVARAITVMGFQDSCMKTSSLVMTSFCCGVMPLREPVKPIFIDPL
jgi:hypothetical protein